MIGPRSLLILAGSLVALGGDAHSQGTPADGAGGSAAVECARRVEAISTAGGADAPQLVDLCPELAAQLQAGAWANALGATRADELAARSQRELLGLIAHYEAGASAASTLGVDELGRIVESLGPLEPVVELSLWDMLSEWVKERLGFGEASSGGGFVEWLRNLPIPDEWIRTLVYVLGISIVIAALIVAVNELRVSGVLGARGGARRAARIGLVEAWTSSLPRTLDAVRKAPIAQQPVLLLALLVDRLRARYGERVRDSMTHRELVESAESLGIVRRRELAAVVSAAERTTYAGWRPERGEVEPVLSRGKAVLEELESEPTRAGPSE